MQSNHQEREKERGDKLNDKLNEDKSNKIKIKLNKIELILNGNWSIIIYDWLLTNRSLNES